MYTCQFVLKILRGNEFWNKLCATTVTNLQKITGYNPKRDFDNINANTKFGQILPICSHDIEQKQDNDISQGP